MQMVGEVDRRQRIGLVESFVIGDALSDFPKWIRRRKLVRPKFSEDPVVEAPKRRLLAGEAIPRGDVLNDDGWVISWHICEWVRDCFAEQINGIN